MPLSRSFYFIRHGQTDWNLEGRMQGQIDIPLNETGRDQAHAAIPYFKNLGIDLIVSSPLSRAYETAEIIESAIDAPLKKHDDLQERYFGSNQGKLSAQIRENYKNNPNKKVLVEVSSFPHALDAESYYDLQDRVIEAVGKTLLEVEGSILFVGHGGVFSALHRVLFCNNEGSEYARSDNAVPYYFEKLVCGSWDVQKVTL